MTNPPALTAAQRGQMNQFTDKEFLAQLASASVGAEVTPSDTVALTVPTRALWVGTGGDIAVKLGGSVLSLVNVPDGRLLPICPTHVMSTGTTASDIVALG